MRFTDGLPVDSGASDEKDSSRLAGLLALFHHSSAPSLKEYVILNSIPVRHPTRANNPFDFSRDQLICLSAGIWSQGHYDICNNLYQQATHSFCRAPNWKEDDGTRKLFGGDILLPHHMNHLKRCAGKKISFDPLLILDIIFNALFTPKRESNQLLSLVIVAGPAYVRFYKKITPQWREALLLYWSGWRNEKELALFLIDKIEGI